MPWGKLIRSRNLWAICFMYVVTNYCWYFLMYFLPSEMKGQFPEWNSTPTRKDPPGTSGRLPAFGRHVRLPARRHPVGSLHPPHRRPEVGPAAVRDDRLRRRRACYFAAARVKSRIPNNLFLFALFLILMGFMNDLIMAPAWAVCQDIGRDYAATVSGTMNMFGNLVGAVSTLLVTGLIMKHYPATRRHS